MNANKKMLRTSDTSSDEDDFNLVHSIAIKIRTFMRMKESELLRKQLASPQKKRPKNCRVSFKEKNNEEESSSEMDSSLDENEKTDLLIKSKENTWERYWSEIDSLLRVLKDNDEHHRCIELCTSILDLHVKQRLYLGFLQLFLLY